MNKQPPTTDWHQCGQLNTLKPERAWKEILDTKEQSQAWFRGRHYFFFRWALFVGGKQDCCSFFKRRFTDSV